MFDKGMPDVYNEIKEEVEFIDGELINITEYSKVYKTGENTYTTVYTGTPNFFVNESGEKVKVDNTLIRKSKTLFSKKDIYTNKASDIDITLPSSLDKTKGIDLSIVGYMIELLPLSGGYDKSAVKDNAILYNDVYEGVDIQYTAHEFGLNQDIILNQNFEKHIFDYELKTDNLTPKLEEGAINLYSETEDKLFTISIPQMSDASGLKSDNVVLNLKKRFDKDILTIEVDKDWVESIERTYPVKVDSDITISSNKIVARTISQGHGVYAAPAYGYVGYMTGEDIGINEARDLEITRMFYQINESFDGIPKEAEIESLDRLQ